MQYPRRQAQSGRRAPPGGGDGLQRNSDRELIARFADQGDDEAFRRLVERHGRLVYRACRGILGHDRDDAFQATFLVLVRKAGRVRWRASLGGWLYATACRIALKLAAQLQRHRMDTMDAEPAVPDCFEDLAARDSERTLHENLNRLPERYRAPLVLWYLEGKSRREAAEELELSPSQLKRRLERGRHELRLRLWRSGIGLALPVAAGAGTTSAATAKGASSVGSNLSQIRDALVTSTVRATTTFAAGGSVQETNVGSQYQVEIPGRPIHREFYVHFEWYPCCEQHLQGRHELQTFSALGAAAAQLGPQAQAALLLFNKRAGLSHGKGVELSLKKLFGLRLSRGGSAHAVQRAGRRCQAALWNHRADRPELVEQQPRRDGLEDRRAAGLASSRRGTNSVCARAAAGAGVVDDGPGRSGPCAAGGDPHPDGGPAAAGSLCRRGGQQARPVRQGRPPARPAAPPSGADQDAFRK